MTKPELRLLIDGALVEPDECRRYEVIDPARGSPFAEAVDATPAVAGMAVGAARRAFDETDWRDDRDFRHRCLVQLQDALRDAADEITDLQVTEAGQVVSAARTSVQSVISGMSFMTDQVLSYDFEESRGRAGRGAGTTDRFVRREPYGVAALISPWNAPFLTNIWKLTPALAAGNTCVLKAAPQTPFSATTIGRIIHDHTDIPAGVVNVLTSEDKAIVGDALTGDSRVDLIHFTGSPAVGEHIMRRAATGLRHVALELGGKSANIVLDDADLDVAVPFSAMLACALSGQGCALPTRILLPPVLHDEVVERLAACFAAFPVGDPADPLTLIGPIINHAQLDRIVGLVDTAQREGAQVVTGGSAPAFDGPLAGGAWMRPTLLVDVAPESTIAQTEVFGPVLCVQRYEDDHDAVRIANATLYGLSSYIQTQDPDRAMAMARRLRAGGVGIGATIPWAWPDLPFGGYGISGVGREHGVEGLEEYLQTKAITLPAPR